MKKIPTAVAAFLVAGLVSAHAQTGKDLPPPPPPPPKIDISNFKPPIMLLEFYKRNPSVALVHWNNSSSLRVKLKDGKMEDYDLSDEMIKKAFIGKYGAVPETPPPPPPPQKPKKEIE